MRLNQSSTNWKTVRYSPSIIEVNICDYHTRAIYWTRPYIFRKGYGKGCHSTIKNHIQGFPRSRIRDSNWLQNSTNRVIGASDFILVTEYKWKLRFSSMLTDFLPFPMRGLLREQRTKAWTWKTKRSEHWLDSVLPRVSTHSRLLKTQSCYKATVHPPCFPSSWSGLDNRDGKKGTKRSGTFATDMVMNKTCHSCLFAAILILPPPRSQTSLFFRGTKSARSLHVLRALELPPSVRGISSLGVLILSPKFSLTSPYLADQSVWGGRNYPSYLDDLRKSLGVARLGARLELPFAGVFFKFCESRN